jgi:AbrB family looped-hinge helix DNA binding protein
MKTVASGSLTKISSNYQVTVPARARKALGLRHCDDVQLHAGAVG